VYSFNATDLNLKIERKIDLVRLIPALSAKYRLLHNTYNMTVLSFLPNRSIDLETLYLLPIQAFPLSWVLY
jgi:hypothetical protein